MKQVLTPEACTADAGMTVDHPQKFLTTPPDWVGPYRIDKILGMGGMGVVYQAYHERLERAVALKQIRPDVEPSEARRRAFLTEARIVAQLSHPNIVQVYDILDEGGEAWMVMELVSGPTLLNHLEDGPLPIRKAISIGLEIARGLAAAHAHGVVHRDLKAGNIKCAQNGKVKILDFGLAHLIEMEPSFHESKRVAGTPRAMSPEQALGQTTTSSSDLFSLGSLLYELISGIAPFHCPGGTAEILKRVCIFHPQPLHGIDPSIPRELSDLVDQMLAKEPAERPPSVESIALELQKISRFDHEPVKILFVDDEPDFEVMIRQRYRKKIRAKECLLEFAYNGKDCLQKLKREGDIGLVMTDLKMPEMDGLGLLQELHRISPDLVTVVVSAYGDMSNIRSAMNSGAFDFLIKPIDFTDLENTRTKALDEVHRRSERRRLREENHLLNELNQLSSEAFRQDLRRDLQTTFTMFSEIPKKDPELANLVRIQLENLEDLTLNSSTEIAVSLLAEYFSFLVANCAAHHGMLLEFHPLETCVAFGLPFAMENDLQRTVDFALDLKNWASRQTEISAVGLGLSLQIKIHFTSSRDALEETLLQLADYHFPDNLNFQPNLEETTIQD